MKTLSARANAKINLTLDITGKRPDNYHLLDSVMMSISLSDRVTVSVSEGDSIEVLCSKKDIPCGSENIAYKAANVFLNKKGIECKVDIYIEKNIPSQAGLGGGSADAAATIVLLDRILNTRCSKDELIDIAKTVGADVPFCLFGGIKRLRGIGEIIDDVDGNINAYVLVAKGKSGVSTARAYQVIDEHCDELTHNTESFLKALSTSPDKAAEKTGNAFEITAPTDSITIKEFMIKNGAVAAHLSGSGSAVYGLFNTEFDAQKACKKLVADGYFATVCRPRELGIEFINLENNA